MKKYSKIFGKDTIAVLEPLNSDNLELVGITEDTLIDVLCKLLFNIDYIQRTYTKQIVYFDPYMTPDEIAMEIKHKVIQSLGLCLLIEEDGTEILKVSDVFRGDAEIARVVKGSLRGLFLLDNEHDFRVVEKNVVINYKEVDKPNSRIKSAMGLMKMVLVETTMPRKYLN